VFGHWLTSPVDDAGVPFDWDPFVATVVVDELEEVDDTDEDEFVRCRGRRVVNMPRTSSGFIDREGPPLTPHADRLSGGKEGGLATAVIRKAPCSL
jgi:hypothetical protein